MFNTDFENYKPAASLYAEAMSLLSEEIEEVAPSKAATHQQPEPLEGQVNVVPLVIADIEARAALGFEKYGKPLQTFNGRDSLADLYQEILDAACYLKQYMLEREELKRKFSDVQNLPLD